MSDINNAVDKGKGRATDPETSTASSHPGSKEADSSSVANRILASATGLARDLVAPGNSALSSSLAGTAASSGKVRPTALSSNHDRATEVSQIASGSSADGTSGTIEAESFRTASDDAAIVKEFEDFQQPKSSAIEEVVLPAVNGSNQWAADFKLESNHVKEYSEEDGIEVAQLLSDPYFVAMTEDTEPEPDQSGEDAADLFTNDFDAETAQATKAIKEDLPAPPIHQPVAADHPRNLVANLEALLEGTEFQFDSGSYSAGSMVHFHSEQQQREFYSQWSGVLNQYTDEVWGDMLPVVQEEKKHAEAIKDGKEAPDSKSVQRLNLILGHVEQYRHWRG